MRCLVTGSEGFLGRHFVARLSAEGHTVVTNDLRHPYYPFDCRDFFCDASLVPLPEVHSFDLVIHCAANVGGREQIEGNPLAVAENLSIDEAMFRWAVKVKPGRVLYLSSSAAYPVHLQSQPGRRLYEDDIDLDNIATPDQTYGWCKLTGELLAREARANGVNVTVVRPFSGYGEDQDPTYPFRAFIERAKAQKDPFQVWGDGTQTRDFIHVDDLVNGALAACRLGFDGPVNLGWGEPVSFGELALLVFEMAGYCPEVEFLDDKPTGVAYRVADPTFMRTFFQPRISLEEGLARALTLATTCG